MDDAERLLNLMKLRALQFRGIHPDETPRQYAEAFGLDLLEAIRCDKFALAEQMVEAMKDAHASSTAQQNQTDPEALKERLAMFKSVTKGLSAYDVALVFNSLTRGIDFRGCSKAHLTQDFLHDNGVVGTQLQNVTEDDLRSAVDARRKERDRVHEIKNRRKKL